MPEYLIRYHDGLWAEMSPDRTNEEAVIEDIAGGQYQFGDRPMWIDVWCIDREISHCQDVTWVVADQIVDLLIERGETAPYWLQSWLDEHLLFERTNIVREREVAA